MFPLTHFLRMIRAVMLKGADLAAISGHLAALALLCWSLPGARRWRGSAARWTSCA
ncbi:MAG: hypothetical protein R3D78_10390 [Paracoccaceae bacterium]